MNTTTFFILYCIIDRIRQEKKRNMVIHSRRKEVYVLEDLLNVSLHYVPHTARIASKKEEQKKSTNLCALFQCPFKINNFLSCFNMSWSRDARLFLVQEAVHGLNEFRYSSQC